MRYTARPPFAAQAPFHCTTCPHCQTAASPSLPTFHPHTLSCTCSVAITISFLRATSPLLLPTSPPTCLLAPALWPSKRSFHRDTEWVWLLCWSCDRCWVDPVNKTGQKGPWMSLLPHSFQQVIFWGELGELTWWRSRGTWIFLVPRTQLQ